MSLTWVGLDGNTWPLDGSLGVMTVGEAEGIFSIPTDLIIAQRVGSDGGVLVNSRYAPRRVALNLWLTDSVEILSTWRQLVKSFASGGSLEYEGAFGSYTLRGCTLEAPDRSQTGRDLNFQTDDVIPVTFLALDPWWTDLDLSVEVLPIVAPTAYDAAISYDAVLPYNGGSSKVVTVLGDAPAYPDFYVRGPFTTLTVSIDGVAWTLAGVLADGVEMNVTADAVSEVATGGRGPRLASDNQVDWSLLTEASRLPTLPVGSTPVVVGGTGTGVNSACWVFWVSRWLTP